MQPKIELKQIRNTSEIVDDSITFIKQNWKPLFKAYFVICGFFVIAGMAVSVVSQVQMFQNLKEGESAFTMAFFVAQAFEFVSLMMVTLTTLSYVAVYRDKGNEAPMVEEVWGYVRYYFFRMLGGAIVLALLLTIGMLFCLIPGFYLFPVFALVMPVMVLENAGFGYAFNRAFKLISNSWGPMFGVIMLSFLIMFAAYMVAMIPGSAIAAIGVMLTGQSGRVVFGMVLSVIAHLIQFTYVLPIIATALAYFSYNEKLDDVGLMDRIQTLGRNNTPANDNLPTEEY